MVQVYAVFFLTYCGSSAEVFSICLTFPLPRPNPPVVKLPSYLRSTHPLARSPMLKPYQVGSVRFPRCALRCRCTSSQRHQCAPWTSLTSS
ncbi:unnamed protein product, partial [Closterium sp. NIES-53]